jgi:hypothetical protein
MSPLAFFTMSKIKTIAWAVFCVVLAILLAYIQLGIFSIVALTYAGFLGCIAAYKFVRDRGIIQHTRIESEHPAKAIMPPMTSPGSNRLFVPQPLERNK